MYVCLWLLTVTADVVGLQQSIYHGITTGLPTKKRRVADCDRELHNRMEKKRREELRIAQESLKVCGVRSRGAFDWVGH
jgi:hypothetical protein